MLCKDACANNRDSQRHRVESIRLEARVEQVHPPHARTPRSLSSINSPIYRLRYSASALTWIIFQAAEVTQHQHISDDYGHAQEARYKSASSMWRATA